MKKIFKIIILYSLVLILGIIGFINFTSLSVQEALFVTALIEIFTIAFLQNILKRKNN